jgi:hypothetical protein
MQLVNVLVGCAVFEFKGLQFHMCYEMLQHH